MTTRAEHLRQLARKCALKAAGAKDLAMKASLRQEQKQLLMLAEQAEKDEQNRMELPPRGLTKKLHRCGGRLRTLRHRTPQTRVVSRSLEAQLRGLRLCDCIAE